MAIKPPPDQQGPLVRGQSVAVAPCVGLLLRCYSRPHYRFHSFVTRFDDPTIEPAFVTFYRDRDGAISRVTMKPVSTIVDFSSDYPDLGYAPAKRRPELMPPQHH